MEIIQEYNNIELKKKQVVTIGVFDGFHRGHLKIAGMALELSNKENLESTIIVIDSPAKTPKCLTTIDEKLYLFKQSGFTRAIILNRSGSWNKLSADDFINNFLIKINTKYIVVGKDFRFGKDRSGDIKNFKKFSTAGLNVIAVPLYKESNGTKISSSIIKKLIMAGELSKAENQLGRNYFILGKKIQGDRLGNFTGFPTINFSAENEKLLPFGVFRAEAIFNNASPGDSNISQGACFIGKTSSKIFSESKFKIELYLLNYFNGIEKDIKGIKLIEKLRDTMEFSDIKDFKTRIKADIDTIKKRAH